ncbi:hypothetical protein VTJ04DRAFT_2534 [Mycothermus thermophilus]|uniref:uncharacterized protein n=1 Tax=Humicola insolens TaxID=85995 RepID=UPI0037421454
MPVSQPAPTTTTRQLAESGVGLVCFMQIRCRVLPRLFRLARCEESRPVPCSWAWSSRSRCLQNPGPSGPLVADFNQRRRPISISLPNESSARRSVAERTYPDRRVVAVVRTADLSCSEPALHVTVTPGLRPWFWRRTVAQLIEPRRRH